MRLSLRRSNSQTASARTVYRHLDRVNLRYTMHTVYITESFEGIEALEFYALEACGSSNRTRGTVYPIPTRRVKRYCTEEL